MNQQQQQLQQSTAAAAAVNNNSNQKNDNEIGEARAHINQQSSRELAELKKTLAESQSKAIQEQLKNEDKLFQLSKVNRQLSEDNDNLSLQIQQLQSQSSQLEARYKKEQQAQQELYAGQLSEAENRAKDTKLTYKSKNKELRVKITELKDIIQEIKEESEENNRRWAEEKHAIEIEAEQLKAQMEEELSKRQTEVANALQTGLNNLEQSRETMRREFAEKHERQSKILKEQLDQELLRIKKKDEMDKTKRELAQQQQQQSRLQMSPQSQSFSEANSVKQENEKLKANLADLKTQHSLLTIQLAHTTASLNARSDALEDSLLNTQKSLGKVETEKERAQKVADQLKSDMDNLREKLQGVSREKEIMSVDKRSASKKIDELERKHSESAVLLERYKSEILAEKTKIDRLSDSLARAEEQLKDFKNNQSPQFLQLEERYKSTQQQYMQLQSQYNQQGQQLNQVTEELLILEETKEDITKKLSDSLERVKQLESSNSQAAQAVSQGKEKVENITLQFENVQKELQQVQEENQNIGLENAGLQERILEQKGLLEETTQKLEESNNKCRSYMNQFETCKMKLKAAFEAILASLKYELEVVREEFIDKIETLSTESQNTVLLFVSRLKESISETKRKQQENTLLYQEIQYLKGQASSYSENKKQPQSDNLDNKIQSYTQKNELNHFEELIKSKRESEELKAKVFALEGQIQRFSKKYLGKQQQQKKQQNEESNEFNESLNSSRSRNHHTDEYLLELDKVKLQCQAEIKNANEKVLQMQNQLQQIIKIYNQQLYQLTEECKTKSKDSK